MLSKWLDKIKHKSDDGQPPEPEQLSATVRVIGDRSSGKTTYMAALARWPNADPDISPVQTVTPINTDGESLITKAKNILEQGERLEPTPLNADVDEVKDYSIRIMLKNEFSWHPLRARDTSPYVMLNISCKDYSGEFFADVLHRSQTSSSLMRDYIQDCLQAEGIMMLVDGLSHRKDPQYANGLDKLLKTLDRQGGGVEERRIALVLTKCEQPELWVNRSRPQKLAKSRFPQVVQTLQTWKQLGSGSIDYFTSSAFGMMGKRYPEPNITNITRDRGGIKDCILKNPQVWKPFGLVAPIYWLCTGERHKDLDLE
ncbi:MAG: hypothetical protein AB4426_09995 [Xenococcaceae cyanobacterium]